MQEKRIHVPAEVKTKLDEMNLLDRFLFNETVEDMAVYNDMVEILMGEEIAMIQPPETEKELRVSPQLREVRLDVIGKDEDGAIYQVEMQKKNTYSLPKRSRFYQAQIDVSLLKPGCTSFHKLNDLTTILVAPFDVFGYRLYRYTFEEYCKEIPGLRLEDGARRIFINTMGENREEFSKEFLDFMEYINASTDEVAAQSESEKIQRIHKRVRWIKASEKIGVKLMQRWEELANAREEGLEEGRKTGRHETYVEMVKKGLISVADAAHQLKISEDELNAILN